MMWDKDIKFPEKKIDAGWKEEIQKIKTDTPDPVPTGSKSQPLGDAPAAREQLSGKTAAKSTSRPFVNLISSLGYQTLIHLGEIPVPESGQRILNIEVAQETIDLLVALRDKTEGHQSKEEHDLLTSLIAELQVKFAEHV